MSAGQGTTSHILKQVPTTFEERGVSLPFTTPELRLTRGRPNERRTLELVLPKFAGTNAIYVVPWSALPEVTSLTLFDRLFHAAVAERRATTPGAIRQIHLRMAATGVGGGVPQEAARRALDDDHRRSVATSLDLVIACFVDLGLATEPELRDRVNQVPAMLKDHKVAQRLDERYGLTATDWYGQVIEIGRVLSFAGRPGDPSPPRLRALITALGRFQAALKEWSGGLVGDVVAMVDFIVEVVGLTADRADAELRALDALTDDRPGLVADWGQRRPAVTGHLGRLSWLLDGWAPLVELWETAIAGDHDRRLGAVDEILRALPILPTAELRTGTAQTGRADHLHWQQRRYVRLYEDWRTGRPDAALIRKIEQSEADT